VRGLRIMGEADGPTDWGGLVDDRFLASSQKAPPS